MGEMNDLFSFKINNINDQYLTNFGATTRTADYAQQDRIELYYSINGAAADSSTNLVFNGLIKKVGYTENDKNKVIRIEGISFSEVATRGLVFVTRDAATNVNVMQFLAAAVQSVSIFNTNFGISTNLPAYKYNPVTEDYTGDAFPILNDGNRVSEFYRSLSSVLDKYLQNDYTGDGRYYWYIDSTKTLQVRKRAVGSNITTLVRGVDFDQAKVDINADDVKNFIIVKCGYDPANNPITTRYDDPASRAKFGFKYYMLIDNKIAGDLLTQQGFATNTRYPASYPYTTTWGVVVNDADGFTDAFREQAKLLGSSKGQSYAAARNKGYLKISLDLLPTVAYGVGDKLGITDPGYGLLNYPMRVTQVDYSMDGVQLVIEEEVAVAQ